ncbi:THUMP-like domain-containing protein [Fibrobacter sp.]|uniref:THUMP-like domain-containing protein n=1 Tax=Fibrobacter sp. TaxID=35828 RepID=UPI00386642F8
MFNADLLTSAKVQDFIKLATKKKLDALQVSTQLAKEFSNEDRAAIMDYMALVPKFREKFGIENTAFLLCDKLALEQSTAQDIGRWKANLWPSGPEAVGKTVHDLCCGMGGDSFFLPKELTAIGVDLDENRLAMYRYNSSVMRGVSPESSNAHTILGDVREVATHSNAASDAQHADYFTIDPARRAIEGENQRDLRNLTPTFEEVNEISKHYKGGMAKIPPGYPICEIPRGTEILYIGSRTDCRECLVLFGELAKNPDHVRAVMVDKTGNEIANWTFARDEKREARNESEQSQYDHNYELEGRDRVYRTSSSESDLPLGGISKFIAEPAPVLLRSHLFGVVALAHDETTHLISPGIAYVTSEKPLPAPAFANYEILESSEISTGAVRAMLKSHDIGKLTLKLRGVKVDPDQEIKRLKPKGKNSATLFYTRLDGEKIAILTNSVKEMPASAGMTSGGAAPKNQ